MNWIPRAEREPDTGDHVIITVMWSDTDYEVIEDDWGSTVAEVKDGTATPIVQEIYDRMVAWMPMPKPYPHQEIIYCKDCKYCGQWLGIDTECKKFNIVGIEDGDFCSMAERKEE